MRWSEQLQVGSMRASATPELHRMLAETSLPSALPSHWLGKPVEDQRSRVLCAAQFIFARDGFDKAEQLAIASLARVGKGTLYKVAQNKEALFLAVVSENLEFLKSLVFARLIGTEPPLDRMRLAARDVLRQISENRGLVRVIVQEAGMFGGEIQRRYIATVDESMPMVEALYSLVRSNTPASDFAVRDVLNMMVKLLIGTAYTWAITGEGNLEEEGMRYLHMLEKGLLSV